MTFALTLLSVGAFFGLMLAASEAGWRIGRARLAGTASSLAKGAVEFPRLSVIRVDSADAVIFDLLETMR